MKSDSICLSEVVIDIDIIIFMISCVPNVFISSDLGILQIGMPFKPAPILAETTVTQCIPFYDAFSVFAILNTPT